jgi:hypothetical protein
MSVREGLWWPIFWVLIVKTDSSVCREWSGGVRAVAVGVYGGGVCLWLFPSASTTGESLGVSSSLEEGLL